MSRTTKIAIISGIIAVVLIGVALTVHFRLSETERSEIESGAEQNENESPSQVAKEIIDSLQNKPEVEQDEASEQSEDESAEKPYDSVTTSHMAIVPVEISAKEVDETYRWANSDELNPTITLIANQDNTISIANPTDAKHEFVIEADGEEIAASGDIGPDSTGNLVINPTKTGILEYHCEYHPVTMKGTIEVKSK